MKLLLLLITAVTVFHIGNAEQTVCKPGDQGCGNEFGMKDVNIKFDLNLGEIKVKQGKECGPAAISYPPPCTNRILSLPYESRMLIDNEDISPGDFLRCELENIDVVGDNDEFDNVDALEIHTDANKDWTFFSAPEEKCLTFEVKAPSNARIALANSIQTFDKIEVELGAESNSKVTIKRLGSNCANDHFIFGLLNEQSFNSFWISWTDDYVHVGRENENLIAITDKRIDEKIRFIGLSTTRNSTGVWKILKPNCPGYYNPEQKEKLKYTEASCVKIENTCPTTKAVGPTLIDLLNKLKISENNFYQKRSASKLSLAFMNSLKRQINNLNDQAIIIQEKLHNCKADDPLCNLWDNNFTEFKKIYDDFSNELNSEINYASS